MFSASIIHAVHVLLELDKVSKNKPSDGLLSDDFQILGEMRRPTLRKVLRVLVNGQYIALSNRKYSAKRCVEGITLLNLIQLFHGGVCIGESYDHYLSIGPEWLPTKEYRQLWDFECRMRDKLASTWLMMPVSSFRQRPRTEKPRSILQILKN